LHIGQSETIMTEVTIFSIKTKQETFEKVLLNIIPLKFGYNWPRSFNEDCNVKSLGDRRQV